MVGDIVAIIIGILAFVVLLGFAFGGALSATGGWKYKCHTERETKEFFRKINKAIDFSDKFSVDAVIK